MIRCLECVILFSIGTCCIWSNGFVEVHGPLVVDFLHIQMSESHVTGVLIRSVKLLCYNTLVQEEN